MKFGLKKLETFHTLSYGSKCISIFWTA